MNFNISMLQNFVKCPQLAYVRDIQGWAKPGTALPFTIGTMFHAGMEQRALGNACPNPFELLQADPNPATGALEQWEKHGLQGVIEAWERPPGWKTAMPEKTLSGNLGGHTGQGRIDVLLQDESGWWNQQYKTYESGLDSLIEKVRLSWHEVFYQWLAEQNGYPVLGTILLAAKKFPSYQMVTDPTTGKKKRQDVTQEMRNAGLTTHYLIRSDTEQARILNDILFYVQQMDYVFGMRFRRMGSPPRNTGACWNFQSRCPLYSHCWEGVTLGAPNFVQLAPRYTTPEVSELQ